MTSNLLSKYDIDPRSIGRLDVGTESIIDKSKSVKTILMDLFAPSGNYDIEGIDSKNACYGGTAALFNCINWVESSSWDGRFALMVAADIAVYAKGAARAAGGAGAVALLIGPDAPLVFESKSMTVIRCSEAYQRNPTFRPSGTHGNCMGNWWDFFKPELASEYPSVDGPLTFHSYMGGLEQSYENYCAKEARRIKGSRGKANGANGHSTAANGVNGHSQDAKVTIEGFHYIAFHGPYGKIVQKGTARLVTYAWNRKSEVIAHNWFLVLQMYLDYLANPSSPKFANVDSSFQSMPRSKSLLNKDCEKAFVGLSSSVYKNAVWPSTQCLRRLGNMYCAAAYGALSSIIDSVEPAELKGKRIGLFSFGSGLAASFFAIRVRGDTSVIRAAVNLKQRLAEVAVTSCEEWDKALEIREERHNTKDFAPHGGIERLAKGTYYLDRVDELGRRFYGIKQ